MSITEQIELVEDPTQLCAGQVVIPAAKFEDLATVLAARTDVNKTDAEITAIFLTQAKRFSACGANFSDRFGVLRKNPNSGWNYLRDLILEN